MKKFSTKISLMFSVIVFAIMSITGLSNLYSNIQSNKEQVIDYKKNLLEDYDKSIQEQVQSAISLFNYAHKQYESGKLTENEAKILGIELVKELRYGESGYFWIDDTNGILVGHPQLPDKEGSNRLQIQDPEGTYLIQNIIAAATTGKNDGFSEYMWEKPNVEGLVQKRAYSQLFEPWNYIISTGNYMDDIEALVAKQKAELDSRVTASILENLLMVAIMILIFGAIGHIFSKRISKNITKIADHVEEIAHNDLSKPDLHLTTKDEIGKLNISVNQMASHLKEMIESIVKASIEVNKTSGELRQSSSAVQISSNQIATTMQQLASGSELQANYANELSFSMNDFSSQVHQLSENGEAIKNLSDGVLILAHNGNDLMESSIEQMSKIDYIVHQSIQRVEGLDTQAREISQLVSVVKEIADQTNLLALNAAIEAARAGEQGKGFAVVADEVRKLAEQVSVSVTDITSIASNIQNESSMVKNYLQDGYKDVEQGTTKIRETGETFNQISHSVSDMANSIASVSANLADMAKNSQTINNSIQEVASISQQTTASIEQTAGSITHTSKSIEEITQSLKDLVSLAEYLNKIVSQFKL